MRRGGPNPPNPLASKIKRAPPRTLGVKIAFAARGLCIALDLKYPTPPLASRGVHRKARRRLMGHLPSVTCAPAG